MSRTISYLKSGIPLAVLIPAPAITTMFFALPAEINLVTSSRLENLDFPVPFPSVEKLRFEYLPHNEE